MLDNICYSELPAEQWPSFTPAPPAVPSTCAEDLLTFDDIRNLGELCASPNPVDESSAGACHIIRRIIGVSAILANSRLTEVSLNIIRTDGPPERQNARQMHSICRPDV